MFSQSLSRQGKARNLFSFRVIKNDSEKNAVENISFYKCRRFPRELFEST